MTRDEADRIAFALLGALVWALDGHRADGLSRVHQELSEAMAPLDLPQSIPAALERHKGNVTAAARSLGIDRNTIYRHRKKQLAGEA